MPTSVRRLLILAGHLGMFDPSRRVPREAVDPVAQIVRERLPVLDPGDGGEGNGRADRDRQRCPDAGSDLVEDQRDAQRIAEVAGDLEQSAGHCHVAMRRARAVYALRIFKPPRRPRATWSSPRRVARGVIWLT